MFGHHPEGGSTSHMKNPALKTNQLDCGCLADIDDIYRDILLAHNIDVLRHIVVLLLCIAEES